MDELVYNCLIVDDEPIAIRVIKNHLSAFKNLRIAGECNNAIEAIELLSKTKIDLIFLDIQMPQITGIEFLQNLAHPPKIILTTAYREYAIDAFDLDVVDYLLKPISLLRFSKAITRFYQRMADSESNPTILKNHKTDYLLLKADKKLNKITFDEILYIESMGDYLIAHTTTKKIMSKERISHIENLLPSNLFIRVHRGFIVSIKRITAVLPGLIEIDKHKIPIGRNFKADVEKMLR